MNTFDGNWEYDAPQFYDFCVGSPPDANASAWFEAQAHKLQGCRSPLAEVQQNATAGVQPYEASSQTPKAAPQTTTHLTAKAPSSAQPMTATKSQARNIVTSWAAREDTSTRKRQEQPLCQPSQPPKSASKRGPHTSTPAQQQRHEEAKPDTVRDDTLEDVQARHALDEGPQHEEGSTGQQGTQAQPRPDKRAALAPPCHPANKAQRVSEQQRTRSQPHLARSASKAEGRAASPGAASKAGAPKEPLRAAMAKARATRTAKAAAASAPAAAQHPEEPAAFAAVPHKATTQPRPKRTAAAASRTRAAAARAAAACTRAPASTSDGKHAATGAAAQAPQGQQQPRHRADPHFTDDGPKGARAVAAPPAAAPRTRAAYRNRHADPDAGRAAARSTNPSLGVARGSGVAKVRGGSSAAAAAGIRRTDPIKLRKMLQARKVLPVRSTKPLTLPEEPALGPRRRSPCHASQEPEAAHATTPFKPLVVRVQEFHTRTPARFKAKPAPMEPPRPLSMTQPKEPTLRTSARLRASYFKSREEEELEALANVPKFQARPLNPHILEAPRTTSATKHSAKRAPAQPQPFNFVTDDRLQRRHQQQQQQQQEETFKAMPLNRALLDHPVGLPKRARMSLTVPKSPALRTRSRTSTQASRQQAEEVANTAFKARPVPDFLQIPREFQAATREPPPIQQKPFQLHTDQRGKQHQSRLQAKLSALEQEQEALRVRKAQQLPPTLEQPAIPPKPEPKPLTVPHPFKLRSEVRHEAYVAEFSSHVSEEERQKQAEAEFKARAMWNGLPFRPRESEAPLTAPSEFALATGARASERQAFDQQMEEKWRAIEAEKAAIAEATRKAEEEEVRKYRRTLRFKAKPAPKYVARKSVATSSAKPLTQPKTPQLGRKRKAADSN